MNVKTYVRALLCLYLTLIISSNGLKAQALKVGDTLPPELWSLPLQVINHPAGKETITLSGYKNKLIILDFWATWCGPCISMLPKQDSLQSVFSDKIQILPVTYQTESEVSTFMEKYEKRKGVKNSLPKVVNNQTLKPYFEHATIPHYIWIKNGEVKAITGLDEVKGEKITALLQEENVSMKTKSQVPRMGYASGRMSLMEFITKKKPELISSFNFRSGLSGYIPGLGSEINILKPREASPFFRITITNLPLMRFFQFAYGEGATFTNSSSIVVEAADSSSVNQISTVTDFKEWQQKNTYCYELVVPESHASEAFQIFRDHLSTLFPYYKAVVEERYVPVLALERLHDTSLKVSSADHFTESYDGFTYHFRGASPSVFVNGLNGIYLASVANPVIDMTGFDANIDLTLEANMSSVKELNNALRSHGLVLTKKMANIPILVIKDNL